MAKTRAQARATSVANRARRREAAAARRNTPAAERQLARILDPAATFNTPEETFAGGAPRIAGPPRRATRRVVFARDLTRAPDPPPPAVTAGILDAAFAPRRRLTDPSGRTLGEAMDDVLNDRDERVLDAAIAGNLQAFVDPPTRQEALINVDFGPAAMTPAERERGRAALDRPISVPEQREEDMIYIPPRAPGPRAGARPTRPTVRGVSAAALKAFTRAEDKKEARRAAPRQGRGPRTTKPRLPSTRAPPRGAGGRFVSRGDTAAHFAREAEIMGRAPRKASNKCASVRRADGQYADKTSAPRKKCASVRKATGRYDEAPKRKAPSRKASSKKGGGRGGRTPARGAGGRFVGKGGSRKKASSKKCASIRRDNGRYDDKKAAPRRKCASVRGANGRYSKSASTKARRKAARKPASRKRGTKSTKGRRITNIKERLRKALRDGRSDRNWARDRRRANLNPLPASEKSLEEVRGMTQYQRRRADVRGLDNGQ